MKILELIDQLDNLLYQAKPLPFTENVKVDRSEVFPLLDEIRSALPESVVEAEAIIAERSEAPKLDLADDRIELGRIAATLERLHENQRPVPPPITAAAAEQVRGILEGAERAAGELRLAAERDAEDLVAGAREEAGSIVKEAAAIRTDAQRGARECASVQVDRIEGVAEDVAQGAGELQEEFEALLDRLRGPAVALGEVLGGSVAELGERIEALRHRVDGATLGPLVEPEALDLSLTRAADADLPGNDDVVVARRLELVDTGEFFAVEDEDDEAERVDRRPLAPSPLKPPEPA